MPVVEGVFNQLKLMKTDNKAALKQEIVLALLTTNIALVKSEAMKIATYQAGEFKINVEP